MLCLIEMPTERNVVKSSASHENGAKLNLSMMALVASVDLDNEVAISNCGNLT
jgi:hypothetical protein